MRDIYNEVLFELRHRKDKWWESIFDMTYIQKYDSMRIGWRFRDSKIKKNLKQKGFSDEEIAVYLK
jgi:hypothetical protein